MSERNGQPAGTVLAERPDRFDVLKRALIGRPRSGAEIEDTLLSKKLALPIFASDPLSSVAYATEAALVVLVTASAGGAHLVLPISIAIAAVLAIVVLSYTQTVQAYETSGGAYVVARDNLGTLPSAAPSLSAHKVVISLLFVVLLTLVNLRGVRESGILFALPTYGFV